MAVTRRERALFAAALLLALIAIGWLVASRLTSEDGSARRPAIEPIVRATAQAGSDAAFRRQLFVPAPLIADAAPADAPALTGIVGRIDADAVALVRTSIGETRTLKPGEAVDGWTLQSLAIDAAYFTRSGQCVRVPLPVGDDVVDLDQ